MFKIRNVAAAVEYLMNNIFLFQVKDCCVTVKAAVPVVITMALVRPRKAQDALQQQKRCMTLRLTPLWQREHTVVFPLRRLV